MLGLKRVDELYRNRDRRARELKAEGKKVIGYLCYFAPPELITAAGMLPYRILGNMDDDILEADNYIESNSCPYVRNCFVQDLKGKHDFMDGFVISHTCDTVQRAYGIWRYATRPAYSYMFNVPHTISEWSMDFFGREIGLFQKSLEAYSGAKITDEAIRDAVRLHNENRAIVRQLYEMRKAEVPPISGSENLKTLIVGMSIPADEFNVLLKEVLSEVQGRTVDRAPAGPRVLVWGSIIDQTSFVEMIEAKGGLVVMDDTCIGTRCFNSAVPVTEDLRIGLTQRYFQGFNCPRTYRGSGVARFSYILDLIQQYRVKGVIAYVIAFCDPHKLDYPDLRDYLQDHGYPMLLLNDDYTLSNKEAMENRLEAFFEMLKNKPVVASAAGK